MNGRSPLPAISVLLLACARVLAVDDLQQWLADRQAVEHVYYSHRLGSKPPFEQTMPRDLVEKLVRLDLKKEAVLQGVFGIAITPAMVETEVKRIDATTRAPDILAGLKAALGNDSARFARTVARPIVVERLLRDRFDNDNCLHAPQRHQAEQLRERVLVARQHGASSEDLLTILKQSTNGDFQEVAWQFGPHPGETSSQPSIPTLPTEGKASAGPYAIEAKAQLAQVLSPPENGVDEQKVYFADIPDELQRVLSAQLHGPGDASAVIETSHDFLLYVVRTRTATQLAVWLRTFPKQDFDRWLASQPADLATVGARHESTP